MHSFPQRGLLLAPVACSVLCSLSFIDILEPSGRQLRYTRYQVPGTYQPVTAAVVATRILVGRHSTETRASKRLVPVRTRLEAGGVSVLKLRFLRVMIRDIRMRIVRSRAGINSLADP